jgi:hypothetical protein
MVAFIWFVFIFFILAVSNSNKKKTPHTISAEELARRAAVQLELSRQRQKEYQERLDKSKLEAAEWDKRRAHERAQLEAAIANFESADSDLIAATTGDSFTDEDHIEDLKRLWQSALLAITIHTKHFDRNGKTFTIARRKDKLFLRAKNNS